MEIDLSHGRPAATDLDIHPLISHRWSPRAFSAQPVEHDKLKLMLEAARWAPSSRNEQPWRFLVATTEEPEWLARLQGYLVEGNAWAKAAPVLVASAYRTSFSRNNRPNVSALRDLGAAEENLFLQAFAAGLAMHQMGGFDRERLKRELLPDGFEPGTMIAIGYPGDTQQLHADLREAETRPRERKLLSEVVFGPAWGEPASFV
ncbi:MAG: nitroreductase family protein [Gemmatimonadales bacterium]|jgi:nitroreductase